MTAAIVEISVDQLHESPFNPRKVFDDEALRELAVSIAAEGRVLQPLLVRPRIPELFRGLEDAADTAACGYEIVFGHRRFRAAQLASLASVPCMVRTMDEAEARRAQIAENLQRADVHPIEEAEGFHALMNQPGGRTAEEIAETVGKSRSYVYGRLKLLQAVPEIRQACLKGEIGSEVALLIARLRVPKLQEKALAAIKGKYLTMGDGGAESFRRIRSLLVERFTLELKSAMFDIEDEMLVPEAGHCVRCTKRSGNAPEYADVESGEDRDPKYGYRLRSGADICTDPDCFDAKKKAHLAREAKKLEEKGKTVVAGAAARAAIGADGEVKGAYIELAKVKDAVKKAGVAVVTIQDPRTGKVKQAVKVEDAKAAGVKVETPKPRGGGYDYEAERKKREAEELKWKAVAKARTELHLQLLDKVRAAALQRPRDTVDMQLIAHAVWRGVAYEDRQSIAQLYGHKEASRVEKEIGQMAADTLAMFLLDCVLIDKVYLSNWEAERGQKPEVLLDTAKRYGVDLGELATKPKKAKGKAAQTEEAEA
ncbi:MAG: ParB/RepB/Spo0J family partition protein [Rubrivivax sp.]